MNRENSITVYPGAQSNDSEANLETLDLVSLVMIKTQLEIDFRKGKVATLNRILTTYRLYL